uniref:HAT C-terminal dimerisation domain-containing protein n=1 Tax=Knipowitschia caucasica TaxID=637954 RepID=A0AAV2LB67_KNICA
MVNTTLRVEGSDLSAVRAFKNTVRQQLETRFKLDSDDLPSSIPVVACMLDPRFKHLKFIPDSKRESAYSHLDTLLLDESETLSVTDVGVETCETEQTGKDIGKKARLELDFAELFGTHFESGQNKARGSTATEEARQYFLLPQIPTLDNPLQWWARNERRFPRLARLSKTYLAIPATSTPSERIFSLAGNTITRQRASLHPAHVDELIFLHENTKSKTKKVTEEEERDSE